MTPTLRIPIRMLVVAAAALALFGPVRAEEGGAIAWTDDAKAAFAAAKRDHRPVFVDIWATWCAPCKQMDVTTYVDPGVVEGLKSFVPLKLDADVAKAFVERFAVDAFPTVIVLDEAGEEITRVRGFVDRTRMKALLDGVGAGYAKYAAARGATDVDALEACGRYLLAAGNGDGADGYLTKAVKAAKADAARQESLELALADAKALAGSDRAAAKIYTRLASSASSAEVREAAAKALKTTM